MARIDRKRILKSLRCLSSCFSSCLSILSKRLSVLFSKAVTRSYKAVSRSARPLTRSARPVTRSDRSVTRSDRSVTRPSKALTSSCMRSTLVSSTPSRYAGSLLMSESAMASSPSSSPVPPRPEETPSCCPTTGPTPSDPAFGSGALPPAGACMVPDPTDSESYGVTSDQSMPRVEPDPRAPRPHPGIASSTREARVPGVSEAVRRHGAMPALPDGAALECRVQGAPALRGRDGSLSCAAFPAMAGMSGSLSRVACRESVAAPAPRIGCGRAPLP